MKQSIAVRIDLGMGEGKVAAQVAHASLKAYEDADDDAVDEWKRSGQKKVVVEVEGEDELLHLKEAAERRGLPNALVRDAGHTQVESGTLTALAVGPAADDEVDAVTGELSLL